jgi:hypothetical protein
MITHDAKGMQNPARALARLEKAFSKRAPGSLLFKKITAVVAAVQHMVDRTGILETKGPGHKVKIAAPERQLVND